jgi:hypothetical protein
MHNREPDSFYQTWTSTYQNVVASETRSRFEQPVIHICTLLLLSPCQLAWCQYWRRTRPNKCTCWQQMIQRGSALCSGHLLGECPLFVPFGALPNNYSFSTHPPHGRKSVTDACKKSADRQNGAGCAQEARVLRATGGAIETAGQTFKAGTEKGSASQTSQKLSKSTNRWRIVVCFVSSSFPMQAANMR